MLENAPPPASIPQTNRFRGIRSFAQRARVGLPFGLVNRLDVTGRLYLDSDKANHGYLPYYRRHLGPSRLRANTILEIGVGGYDHEMPGGSLRIWRDSFPRSKVIGVDLYEKAVDLGPRVSFMQADQNSASDLRGVVDRFGVPNIVIDDGSHVGEHINVSFRTLFPLMPLGSIYVVEDLHTSYWSDFGGAQEPSALTGIGLLRSLLDDVQSNDPTFDRTPSEPRPRTTVEHVSGVSVYPGIAFISKS